MKKLLIYVVVILGFVLLTYSILGHIFLNDIISNIRCYIHTTPAVLYGRSEKSNVSDADRKYLCSYWGFSNDEFDDYRDHPSEFCIADITITIINDSGMGLHKLRLIPPQNAQYWFNEASICECYDHTIRPYSQTTKTVNALVRITDELLLSSQISATDFPFELHFGVDFCFSTLRTSIQSLPSGHSNSK